MTQLEQIQLACDALAAKMPSKATVRLSINSNDRPYVYCCPNGPSDKWCIIKYGDPMTALAEVEAEWEAKRAEVDTQLTKAIALAIIRLTHEFGSCTDAQLRADFDVRDVERLGAAAVELANTMADRGPFSIEAVGGANDRSAA